MFQPFASLSKSPLKRCSVAPATVRLSMLTPSETGIGRRCDPAKYSAKVLMAASGRRRCGSGSPRMRSRSICGDDSTPVKRGDAPKLTSASPRIRIGRSSGPYWNSICSTTARLLLPSIFPVRRQGSRISACDPAGARVSGRASVTLPTKRGMPFSIETNPSASAVSGRSMGSTLTRTRTRSSPTRLAATR